MRRVSLRPIVEGDVLKTPRFSFKRAVLLTGAGFTKDFGGLLVDEMWAWIFNHQAVQARPRVAGLLRADQNFESVYTTILYGVEPHYDDGDRTAISEALRNAYLRQDEALRNYHGGFGLLREFIRSFAGADDSERGFFFTLNQDLLIERFFTGDVDMHAPCIAGHFNGLAGREERIENVTVPDGGGIDHAATRYNTNGGGPLAYIKLHGSMNWVAPDGKSLMIIGDNKHDSISQINVLRYYFAIFKKVLAPQGQQLVAIGYSFGDSHINKAIAEAVQNSGLKVIIVNPNPPKKFCEEMMYKPSGAAIWNGLSGYFPWRVKDIFTSNESQRFSEINRAIRS